MLALLAIAAWGAVRTQDDLGCVDPERLDLELRSLVGDEVADGVDVFVRVTDGDPRAITVRVSRHGDLLWGRELQAVAEDCPLLPSVIARSVDAGLAELPAWQLLGPSAGPRTELQLVGAVTAPFAPRFSIAGRLVTALVGPLRLGLDLEGGWSLVQPVEGGGVQMASVVAAAGPVIRLPVGRDALQVGVRGCVGPAVVSGRGFEENHTTVAPRVGTHAEVLFASRRALRVGVRGELPITRMAWTVPDTGESTLEPPVRAGIVLGIGGAVRSGDGDAQVRP
ncbi:MAG: hypothetical protein KC621_30785 [Myxococcales bacterium]|nr:hypothetical protein [Myxococcales bacterium]